MREPALAAEANHAGEGQSGIRERDRGDEAGHRRIGIHELEPGKGEQQNKRGPQPKRRRVAQTQA